jgi:hypothetical protein
VPEIRKVTVDPDTVQTVVVLEEYTTARVEPAVAPRVSGVPTVCVPGFANVIVCGVPATVIEWLTCGAAA